MHSDHDTLVTILAPICIVTITGKCVCLSASRRPPNGRDQSGFLFGSALLDPWSFVVACREWESFSADPVDTIDSIASP